LLPFDYYNVGIEVTGARPNRLTPNQRGQLTALVDEDKSRRSKLGRKRANPASAGYLVRTVNANTGEVDPALDIAEFRLDHADDPEMLAALDWIESGSNEVPVGGYILQRVTEEALEDERVRDQIAFDEWEAEKYNEMNRLRYEDEDDDTRDNRLTPNQRGQLTALVDEDKSRRSKLGRKRSNITPEGRDERLTVLREARANRLTPNQRGQLDLLVAEDTARRSKLGRKRSNITPEGRNERPTVLRETRANAPGDRQRRRKRGEHEHLLAQIQMTSRLLAEAEMNRPPREVERLSRMLDSLVDQAEQEGLRAQAEWSMRHGRDTGTEHGHAVSDEADYYLEPKSAYNLILAAQDAEESRLLRGSSTRGSARANRLTPNQRGQLTALVDEDKSRRSRLGRKRANPTASHFGPTETDAELLKALTLARKHLGHRSGPFHDDVPHATRDAAMKELVRIEAEAQDRGVRKNPTARERAALEMLIAEHDGRAAKRGYTAAKKSAAKKPAAKPAAKKPAAKPAAKKPAAKPAAKRTKK
jgi:hypothetical protein